MSEIELKSIVSFNSEDTVSQIKFHLNLANFYQVKPLNRISKL